jgi:iron only hydrogenase large subunit-like protein
MKRKFSNNLIWKAMDFARAAKEDLGDALGDEHIERMFDAFDPSLRRQIFMEMLMGHTGGVMRVKLVDTNIRKKIEAIKAVRSVTRFGLREAKDVIDTADSHIGVIEGSWSSEHYNQLKRELANTGYELV